MKKNNKIIVLLSIIITSMLYAGCESKPQQVRVCIDMEYLGVTHFESAETVMQSFLDYVIEYADVVDDRELDVALEVIPKSGTERESVMTRLRTEIMAGEGPDVFIMAGPGGPFYNANTDSFFSIPEQAMESGLFLPLDKYMEKSELTGWDNMTQVIMDAGRNEYGQQILPISYTFPVTFYRESDVSHTPSTDITWMDMLEDETNILTAAAVWTDGNITDQHFDGMEAWYESPQLEYILGDLVDYSNGTLLFTEDELLQRITDVLELADQYNDGKFADIPTHYQNYMQPEFDIDVWTKGTDEDYFKDIPQTENLTMIPLYSDDGGISATILYYAAINANTRCADDAFYILDHLFSETQQKSSDIYSMFACMQGLPMQNDLMRSSHPTKQWRMGWYMSTDKFEKYDTLRNQITNVHFRSVLDVELQSLYKNCYAAYSGEGSIDTLVHTSYENMKRMLAE